jgi:hypothetical protein
MDPAIQKRQPRSSLRTGMRERYRRSGSRFPDSFQILRWVQNFGHFESGGLKTGRYCY